MLQALSVYLYSSCEIAGKQQAAYVHFGTCGWSQTGVSAGNALTSRKDTGQACLRTTFSRLVRSPWLGSGGGAWWKHRGTSNIPALTRKEDNNNVGWRGGGMVGRGVSSHSALPLRCCSSYRGGGLGWGGLEFQPYLGGQATTASLAQACGVSVLGEVLVVSGKRHETGSGEVKTPR